MLQMVHPGDCIKSNDCWFQGPSILWQDMKFWPSRDVKAELPNDDAELKKDITSFSILLSEFEDIANVENRIWLKLKRVFVLVLLCKRKLLELIKTSDESSPEVHRNCREKMIGLKNEDSRNGDRQI